MNNDTPNSNVPIQLSWAQRMECEQAKARAAIRRRQKNRARTRRAAQPPDRNPASAPPPSPRPLELTAILQLSESEYAIYRAAMKQRKRLSESRPRIDPVQKENRSGDYYIVPPL